MNSIQKSKKEGKISVTKKIVADNFSDSSA